MEQKFVNIYKPLNQQNLIDASLEIDSVDVENPTSEIESTSSKISSIREKFNLRIKKCMSKENLPNTIFQLVSWALLLISLIVFCSYFFNNTDKFLNSDLSSEQILAKLLADGEGFIFSTEWYYSTEIRVIYTQLIMAPLFKIFSNWHTVRVVGSLLCYILLLLSFYYLCHSINLKKYYAIMALFLITPISYRYADFVLIGLFYISYIILACISIGLIFSILKCRTKASKIILMILFFILSFFIGLGGVKQVFYFYIPLAVAVVIVMLFKTISKNKLDIRNLDSYDRKLIVLTFLACVIALIGYVFNENILRRFFTYAKYEISFTNFSLNRLIEVFNGFLHLFGYREAGIFSLKLFSNVLAVFIMLFIVIGTIMLIVKHKEYSIAEKTICWFFVMNLVISTILYCFTDMVYDSRYNFTFISFIIPFIVITLTKINFDMVIGRIIPLSKVIAVCMFFCAIISSVLSYREMMKPNTTSEELQTIASTLSEQGYINGYANFWNANVLTEFSNGEIEVWHWDSNLPDVSNLDESLYKWLQEKSHFTEKPTGKVFIIFSASERDNYTIAQNHSESAIIYSSENYVIYGYDSNEALEEVLSGNS